MAETPEDAKKLVRNAFNTPGLRLKIEGGSIIMDGADFTKLRDEILPALILSVAKEAKEGR